MPSALENVEKEPTGQVGVVGLRTLPHVKLNYYARAPQANPFQTVWLPMNASKRIVSDQTQDIMHLYYSRHLQDDGKASPTQTSFRINSDLSLPADHLGQLGGYQEVLPKKPTSPPDSVKAAMWMTNVNSLAPFASLGKPTCGFFFSRTTDHKKRLTGIPPTNTVKWRSNNSMTNN